MIGVRVIAIPTKSGEAISSEARWPLEARLANRASREWDCHGTSCLAMTDIFLDSCLVK